MATEKLRDVLSKARALFEIMDSRLLKFVNLMCQLVTIAEKERLEEPPSESEAEMLTFFSEVIAGLPRETPVTAIELELEGFYCSSNMRLLREADEICS